MQETLVRFLDQENPLEKGQVTTPHSRALLVAQLIKGSVCNAGDLGLTPGLGKSLEKGKATHSSILAWRAPYSSWGCKESDTTKRLSLW